NRINEAIKEYEQAVALPGAPASAAGDMIRLIILRKQRAPTDRPTWAEVEQALAKIEQRYPGSPDIVLAKSDLLAAQGKVKEATALLAGARAESKDARLWIHSAHYAEQADRTGLAVLDEAVKVIGDVPELRLKRAAILFGRSASAARARL